MQWSRVKNILILILLGVDLILFGVFLLRRLSDDAVTRNSIAELTLLLQDQGISVAEGAIPNDTERMYVLEAMRDVEGEKEAAGYLLGEAGQTDQGGGIYRYESESGRATFRAGSLEIALSELPRGVTGQNERAAKKLLSAMGLDLSEAEFSADGQEIRVGQAARGLPVFNCQLKVSFNENACSISGGWVLGQISYSDTEQSKSAAYALLSFVSARRKAGTPISEVTGLQAGYLANTAAPGLIRLQPVWRVVADGQAYYINAMNGLEENVA